MCLYRGWIYRWSHRISSQVQRRKARVRRRSGSFHVRFFNVQGIKSAVFRVTGIERHANEAGSVPGIGHKLREHLREADIRSEFLTRLIQNVQSATLIDHEKTRSSARSVCRLGAHAIHATQLSPEVDRS